MSPLAPPRRAERAALFVAAAAAVVAGLLAWHAPGGFWPAWRLAVFCCLAPALGSLIFILIYRLTGGQWVNGLRPFLLAGTRLLPWTWLLIVPLLWFPIAAVPRSGAPAGSPRPIEVAAAQTTGADAALQQAFAESSSRHLDERLRWYMSRSFVIVRALLYAVGFFLLSLGARRVMSRPAADTMRWFGPLGLIGLVLMLHFLATDWIVLLEPGWYSTGFPLVWTSAQAIAGLAVAIFAALAYGANPAERGEAGHRRGLDWGNLLLASVMAWTYVAFVELLIIWSGNLPAEITWYVHRSTGAWRWLAIGLAVFEFGVPFCLLLSRGAKQRSVILRLIAGLLFLGQIGYTIWLILPAFPGATVATATLDAAVIAAVLGLFFNRYLAAARQVAVTLP